METPPWNLYWMAITTQSPPPPTSRHHHICIGTKFYMSFGGDFQTVAPGRDNLQVSSELEVGGKGLHISVVSLWREGLCDQAFLAIRMQKTKLWSLDNLDLRSSPCGKDPRTKSQGRKGVGEKKQTLPVDPGLCTCSLLVLMQHGTHAQFKILC